MVCHETHLDADGNWLFPDEVRRGEGGALAHARTGEPVRTGRSEKMSKSRKNVVDPESIIQAYGADTARLFMLSDSPPERDLDWTDAGVEGAWRYLNRLWRAVTEPEHPLADKGTPHPEFLGSAAGEAERAVHKTIAAVTRDLDGFRFNKAVARVRELTNLIDGLDTGDGGAPWVRRLGLETAVRLLGPMMPHLAEELWLRLGHDTLLTDMPWPEAEASLLVEERITIAVQVNGKLRGTIDLPKDTGQKEAEAAALDLDNVTRAVAGKPVRKVIVVPNRVINVVV